MKRKITKLFAVCLMLTAGAQAATVSWDGGAGDGLFNSATNWNTDYVPSSISNQSDTALLGSGSANAIVSNAVTRAPGATYMNVTMRNGGTLDIHADMSLGNGSFLVGTTGNGKATVTQDAGNVFANAYTLGLPSGSLLASGTLSGTGSLTLKGDLKLQSNSVFTVSGSSCSLTAGTGTGDDMFVNGDGELKFVLDSTGVAPINVFNNFSISSNAQLTVDAVAYSGVATNIDLVTFGTNDTQFATNNISVVGVKSWSVGYDANSMFVSLVPYDAGTTVLLGEDDFDGTTAYLTKVNSDVQNANNLAWNAVDRDTVACDEVIDTSVAAGGVITTNAADTIGFLGTNKTDKVFAIYRGGLSGTRTLTYTFNVAGYSHLNLATDWAMSGKGSTPNIKMAYSFDGGAAVTNLSIGSSGVDWIQIMDDGRVVTNGNSGTITVNGVSAGTLSEVFKTYTPTIAGTGSVLTVTVSMASQVGLQSYGLDNLKLYGDVAPEPGDTLAIGKDNFDDAGIYLSRVNSDSQNRLNLVWDVVDWTTVKDHRIIDTTVASNDFVALNVADTIGYLQSDKTDSFFGMYRGLGKSLTYTFDIEGYENLNMAMDLVASGTLNDPKITMAYSIDGAPAVTNLIVGFNNTDSYETMEIGTSVTNIRTATVTVNGVATNALTDAFQTYTPTISGTGSVLTVTLIQNTGTGSMAFGLDNLVLIGTLSGPPVPVMGYDTWAAGYGLVGAATNGNYDVEPDGLDNLMEYALGGNPTNDDHATVAPATYTANAGGTNWLYHVYDKRVDDTALTFILGATANLVTTTPDTNDVSFVGQSAESGGFRTQTNRTEMTTAAKFISLTVEQ